jgi:hypothetical protein
VMESIKNLEGIGIHIATRKRMLGAREDQRDRHNAGIIAEGSAE